MALRAILLLLLVGLSSPAASVPITASDNAVLFSLKAAWSGPDLRSWTNGGDCSNFKYIDCNGQGQVTAMNLTGTNLRGPLPESIGRLPALIALYLSSNHLTGLVAASIGNLTALANLFLDDNDLTGSMPKSIGNLKALEILYLKNNNLSGPIPAAIGNLARMNYLDLSANKFTGPIPAGIANLKLLLTLSLADNMLTGPIPAGIGGLKSLEILLLNGNLITGSIPASIAGLSSLEYLALDDNRLTGSIPANVGSLKKLRGLSLSRNSITGSIPASIGSLTGLTSLDLSYSYLTGPIPESIANLTALTLLVLGASGLTGPIPQSLGNLKLLEILVLSGNRLSGVIPATIGSLTALTQLYLNNNQLTGPIPASIGNLKSLSGLGLWSNTLTGAIPASVGNLKSVKELDLSWNQLSGRIPASLGGLTSVTYLWLSNNKLAGTIPASISSLPSLVNLDLSNNQLTGQAPVSFLQPASYKLSGNYLTALAAPSKGQKLSCPANSGNCIITSPVCNIEGGQRSVTECSQFCSALSGGAACSGHGFCYLALPGSNASCICDAHFKQGGSPFTCVPAAGLGSYTTGLDMPGLSVLYANKYNSNFRYASYGFSLATSKYSIVSSMDWSSLSPTVRSQGACGACWAFAGVGAIEMAAAIAYNLKTAKNGSMVLAAPILSVQEVLSCLAGSSGCSGGWPSHVFEYSSSSGGLVSNQAYPFNAGSALTPSCASEKIKMPQYPVGMWEQVGLYGQLGLLLALQSQPVVVSIAADAQSFIQYAGGVFRDPSCFSGLIVNHNVLLVGYNLGTEFYWIIKNSWGPGWGEGGYMRLSMDVTAGGEGICGIYTNPAIYPVLMGPSPCTSASNPCGGGQCNPGTGNKYTCTCQQPDFVSYVNVDGTQSCAPVQQCKLRVASPCGVGQCVDDGLGSYSCICPLGFALDKRPTGDPTCTAAQLVAGPKTYTAKGLESCQLILITYNLTWTQFRDLNPGVDCSKVLLKGSIINVGDSVTSCSAFYTPPPGASCASVAEYFSIPLSAFQNLNRGVDCSKPLDGHQLCMRTGNASTALCIRPYNILSGDSCTHIMQAYKLTAMDFFSLNPGMDCESLAANKYAAGQICLGRAPQGVPKCNLGRPYRTLGGESCPSIIRSRFRRNVRLFRSYNKPFMAACSAQYFHAGAYFCVPKA